ncbi:uncharacterized protein LOC141524019 isoform X2 [Cotesia typhae]|uniref:uncharacterized protein LOC141524019 isoform X2 n=1 Tax=Cotesia typhae TaxID=2053667 RepID=UPI003D69EACF
MASIFSVHQTYKSQLDFYEKLDQYEKETGYELMVFDSHTIDTVAKKTRKRMHCEKIILYEAYFRCKKGKKKNCTEKKKEDKEDEEEEETENLKYCGMELEVRFDQQLEALVVKKWKSQHNHDPEKNAKKKVQWVKNI